MVAPTQEAPRRPPGRALSLATFSGLELGPWVQVFSTERTREVHSACQDIENLIALNSITHTYLTYSLPEFCIVGEGSETRGNRIHVFARHTRAVQASFPDGGILLGGNSRLVID